MLPSNDGLADDGPMTRWGFLFPTYCDAMGVPESVMAWGAFNSLTEQQAGDLAQSYFWPRFGGVHLNTGVDVSFVDWRWTSGGSTAVVQRALGCQPDGIIGPLTVKAMNAVKPADLVQEIHGWRCAYYDSLGFRRMYPGLYTRADNILAMSQSMLDSVVAK